jgi:putative addiction module component (TIGR02574 family)
MSQRPPDRSGLVHRPETAQIAAMVRPAFDIAHLTTAQRLELIERLWDSLRLQPALLPPTAAEQAMVAERRAEHTRDPDSAIPWDVLRDDLYADQAADETAGARNRAGERGG